MPTKTITLTMEGSSSEEGHVLLRTFSTKIAKFEALLSSLSGASESHFRVVDLSHSSPASVVIEEIRTSQQNFAVDNLLDIVNDIGSNTIPSQADYSLLKKIKDFSGGHSQELEKFTLESEERHISISDNIVANVDHAISHEETCYTSIEGMLEQINVHSGNNTFTIWPITGPSKITCKFPQFLENKAIDAVNRNVLVSGDFYYRRGEHFPYKVIVDDMEVFGNEEDLPSFADIKGIAPYLTGEESSESFVARIREAWDG